MKKFVCSVCGYVYEGEAAPEFCPLCKAPASKFIEQTEEKTWACLLYTSIIEDLLIFLSGNFSFSSILRIIFTFIPKGILTAIPEFMQQ